MRRKAIETILTLQCAKTNLFSVSTVADGRRGWHQVADKREAEPRKRIKSEAMDGKVLRDSFDPDLQCMRKNLSPFKIWRCLLLPIESFAADIFQILQPL